MSCMSVLRHDMHTLLESAGAMQKLGVGWMQCDELDPQATYTIVTNGVGVQGRNRDFRAIYYSRRYLCMDLG